MSTEPELFLIGEVHDGKDVLGVRSEDVRTELEARATRGEILLFKEGHKGNFSGQVPNILCLDDELIYRYVGLASSYWLAHLYLSGGFHITEAISKIEEDLISLRYFLKVVMMAMGEELSSDPDHDLFLEITWNAYEIGNVAQDLKRGIFYETFKKKVKELEAPHANPEAMRGLVDDFLIPNKDWIFDFSKAYCKSVATHFSKHPVFSKFPELSLAYIDKNLSDEAKSHNQSILSNLNRDIRLKVRINFRNHVFAERVHEHLQRSTVLPITCCLLVGLDHASGLEECLKQKGYRPKVLRVDKNSADFILKEISCVKVLSEPPASSLLKDMMPPAKKRAIGGDEDDSAQQTNSSGGQSPGKN